LADHGESLGDEDERHVVDLLIEQIEFCDVLVVNKLDLIDHHQKQNLVAILSALNPQAEIIWADHGQVPLRRILNTGKFDFEKAKEAPGWLKTLRGEEIAESDSYGITNFTFETHFPFHPQRFMQFLEICPKPLSEPKVFLD